MAVDWPPCTLQDCKRLHFSIMVREDDWDGLMKEFRVQAKQEVQIDACSSGCFDLWRQVVEGMEVVENDVQLTFWNFFPLVLAHRVELLYERLGSRTHDDEKVRIAGLHSGRRRRVLVSHKVFRVYDSDYRIHFEIAARLTFQLSQLEREGRWECRPGTFDDNPIRPEGIYNEEREICDPSTPTHFTPNLQ